MKKEKLPSQPNQSLDLMSLTVDQLGHLAYRETKAIQQAQFNISQIETALARKTQQAAQVPPMPDPTQPEAPKEKKRKTANNL